jgi:hypothetical protein
MFEFPLNIRTYETETKEWTVTTFETKDEFKAFVWQQFKKKGAGHYNLKNVHSWKQAYAKYKKDGYYTSAVKGTYHYKKFWSDEKEKVLNGIICDGFYIPPFYYFYLNYLPIYNKVEGRYIPPDIWDSDYHFMLYIQLCILEGKHAVVVKTRQRGYSFKIMAILYWSYMWFEGAINTIGASDEEYVKKTWKYVDQYRQFIHKNTAWKRGPQMPKMMDWVERTLTSEGDYVGLGSSLSGTTFKQSPSKGVGGPQKFFFYEEAGIAPTLLKTIEYIRPAIEEGTITTGTMIISGSVGELDDCEDLKQLFFNPEPYNFLGVPNVWDDEDSGYDVTGFFVPDTWSLHGHIDANGNSLIATAETFIRERRDKAKGGKTGEQYQLEISQKPLTPKEAFAYRKDAFFPQHILGSQLMRLAAEKPKLTAVELLEKDDGSITFKTDTDRKPIEKFPLKADDDKVGCVTIAEFPEKGAPFLTYFAGVDPVSTDKTTTSESLFSVYIFKTLTETKYKDKDGNIKTKVTGFKPVAWYTGRFDDLKKTNTIGEYLVRFYNAFTVVESNVQTFINHMQSRQMQRYLATKHDISFIADLNANKDVHKQYGVHMTPNIKNYILNNIKEYVSEEQDVVLKKDGTPLRTIYGVERLEDIGLCEEIRQWHDKLNTDRIIAFGLALSMAKSFVMNGVLNRINDIKEDNEDFERPSRSFFKNSQPYNFTYGNEGKPVAQRQSYFKYHA